MAKKLNKTRMRDSKIMLVLALAVMLFSHQYWPDDKPMHELFEFFGYILLAVCALGRMYATAFLGGKKNQELITYGPFSIVRNPLYFFSLIGITGIGFISNHISLAIILPVVFTLLYIRLIKREETFLRETFGKPYETYTKKVPRLLPRFSLYQAPEQVMMTPRFLNKAFADAIWWFLPFPLIELVEYLQTSGILPTLY